MHGQGVAFLPMPHAAPWLASGALMRPLPAWHAEQEPIAIYYPNRKLLLARTRVFIDFVVDAFLEQKLAAKFDGQ